VCGNPLPLTAPIKADAWTIIRIERAAREEKTAGLRAVRKAREAAG
jgi:hypothetical protein